MIMVITVSVSQEMSQQKPVNSVDKLLTRRRLDTK
jgi:hypothetical protein